MERFSWVMGMVFPAVFLAIAGLSQPTARAVDTTPPTGGIIINNNRSATNTPNVTLALTWSDGAGSGVSMMRFSNDGAMWSVWEPVMPARAYTLPTGDGYKTLRVQYLDKSGNRSTVYNDYIRLDTMPPTGTIIINGGASTTNSAKVTLGLTWSDGTGAGVSRMRFSDNGSTWTAWLTPSASRAHTLPAGSGYHTVRVQYLDGANNCSPTYNDYIKLQSVAPGTTETVMLPGNTSLQMVWVPDGTFTMGSLDTEQDRQSDEGPQHSVTLGGFWMGKYELTKRQWQAVMGTTPWSGQPNVSADLDSPAVYVSWVDVQSFITAVSGDTGKTFRLPTESEWEYACRAGTSTRFYWGDDPTYASINDYAWWSGNARDGGESYAHVVGQKLPNAWGLFDMSGNVVEWCEDDYHANYNGAPTGGQAWVNAPRDTYRVVRGGSWTYSGYTCRSKYRLTRWGLLAVGNHGGFRLAR